LKCYHQAAGGFHFLPAGDEVGPIGALHQNIRKKRGDQFPRRLFIEQHHSVDRLQLAGHLSPFFFAKDGTRRPLHAPHGRIGVQPQHQKVAQGSCLFEQANVPAMQQIEAAVGKDYGLPLGAPAMAQCEKFRPTVQRGHGYSVARSGCGLNRLQLIETMEHGAEIATGKWSVPECPLEIEYAVRVLDDIRLAVVDAFFSFPRGGAEIGGLLLGNWDGRRISITGFEPLDCEHATGPSFTLSARDQTRLAEMIAACRRNDAERQPVGWYHSHTRSEIFLSDADVAIHHRFFPEAWQVALVLKPHTFEPTRAGFFFREVDGSLRGKASYREFRLEALPLRPGIPPSPNHASQRPAPAEASAEVLDRPKPKPRVPITREIQVDFSPANGFPQTTPRGQTAALDSPNFGQLSPDRSWRVFKAMAVLATGLALGGVGYQTRQYWLPAALSRTRGVLPHEPAPYLSLAVSDDNGQLKIQWDRTAPAVRNALDGSLQIADGNAVPQSVRLDSAHLAAGGFTYARQSERVDVTLIATEPGGQMVREQASFLGRLPTQRATPSSQPVAPTGDTDAEREKLQKDLNFQAAKTRKLEKDLKDMQEQLEKSKQAPDAGKKNY
jgi:proteasome lid subunit RPN8/RPN11